MKLKILILTTVILLTSCVSTKTYSGYVEKKLETKKNSADIHNESISFDLSQLELQNNTVESEKVKSFFIPAILYWGWENTIECKISPAIVGQTFKSSFLNCADSLGLFNKLNEQQIEISIEKIPTSFVYTNKGNTMIFIIAYTVSELEAIYPQEQNLVINYKLIKNGQTTKTGKLIATNKDKPIKNIWKSTKKFTWLYIDKFDNNIKVMTNDIVEQLLKQI